MLTYKSFLAHPGEFAPANDYLCHCVVFLDSQCLLDCSSSLIWHLPHLALEFLDPWLPWPPLWPGSLPGTEPAAYPLPFSTDSANSWSKFCIAWQWVLVATYAGKAMWGLCNCPNNPCQIQFRQKYSFWCELGRLKKNEPFNQSSLFRNESQFCTSKHAIIAQCIEYSKELKF